MKIILTNDDGFDALGLVTIKEMLKNYGEVYTFAPSEAKSGYSCGFTTYRKPLTVHEVDSHNFKVDGTPVDCVLFANAYLKGDYDLIVSGCNDGYNMANDIMYSGTCGACFQGLVFKKKCIAFSAAGFTDDKHIKKYIPKVLDYVFDNHLLDCNYYLNVNLNLENTLYKGIRITQLHHRYSRYTFTKLECENEYLIRHIHDDDIFDDDDFDVSAVHNGYISITPISMTTYKEEYFKELKNKINTKGG